MSKEKRGKKPIYKRPWFIILIVVIVFGIVMGSQGGSDKKGAEKSDPGAVSGAEEPEITYTAYDVGQLMSDLDTNAMKASDMYKDQYVELTGKLSNIDSSGNYIDIVPADDEFAIIGVQCYLKDEEQKNSVMELSIDDVITVKGKITDVGEVLGYSLDIDSISK